MALPTTPSQLANGFDTLPSTIQLQNYCIYHPSPKPIPDWKVISNDVTTLSPIIQPNHKIMLPASLGQVLNLTGK